MGEKKEREQMIIQCYHCGNKGLHNIVGNARSVWEDYADEAETYITYWETLDWFLLKCPVCEKMSLYTENQMDGMCDFNGNHITTTKIVYPDNSLDFSHVPKDIKNAFEAALKIQQIDSASCLMSLRRILEAICKERNANGDNLVDMIKDLVEKSILPPVYDDASWIIRQLGNKAAHVDTSTSLYRHDVSKVIDFMRTMINYLYVLPHQVSVLKEKIENEKDQPAF